MIGENIKRLRKKARYSQEQIARKLGLTQGSVSSWETGRNNPEASQLAELAKILGVSVEDFFDESPHRDLDAINITRRAVPILGSIHGGKPITPDTEPDGYADLPDGIRADFALRCTGDSMSPLILAGDLVLIRKQPDVEEGQIAAVSIDGETTLKHVYHQAEGLLLIAENSKYKPISAPFTPDREIIIYGLAVGYLRVFD